MTNVQSQSSTVFVPRPTILFISDRWLDAERVGYDSPHQHGTLGSLWAWGQAKVIEIYYDVERLQNGRHVDKTLEPYCNDASGIDLICNAPLLSHPRWCPSHGLLQKAQRDGIKVANFFYDSVNSGAQGVIRNQFGWADLNILADYDLPSAHGLRGLTNCFDAWSPMDTRTYFPGPEKRRDIDVSFVGSIFGGRHRYIEALDELKYNIRVGFGHRETGLTADKYVDILKRSKIALSFSWSGTNENLFHVKSRPMEAVCCGAMLLDGKNYQTDRFFEDGKEYVSFSSEADMLDKIRYFLDNDQQRQEIARNGYQKASEKWSPDAYWTRLLSRLGMMSNLAHVG